MRQISEPRVVGDHRVNIIIHQSLHTITAMDELHFKKKSIIVAFISVLRRIRVDYTL